MTYCHSHALQLVVGDTIKAIKIMRGSLGAAFELTKVIKCSMILKSYKKIKYSPKGASSRLRKDYAARNLRQYYVQIVGLPEEHPHKTFYIIELSYYNIQR